MKQSSPRRRPGSSLFIFLEYSPRLPGVPAFKEFSAFRAFVRQAPE
jgi:hypothetical protein